MPLIPAATARRGGPSGGVSQPSTAHPALLALKQLMTAFIEGREKFNEIVADFVG